MDELRTQLLEHAVSVAAILNVIEDTEERAALRIGFECRLEDELYAGRPEVPAS